MAKTLLALFTPLFSTPQNVSSIRLKISWPHKGFTRIVHPYPQHVSFPDISSFCIVCQVPVQLLFIFQKAAGTETETQEITSPEFRPETGKKGTRRRQIAFHCWAAGLLLVQGRSKQKGIMSAGGSGPF